MGRFPRSVSPDDTDVLPGGNPEEHPVEDGDLRVGLGYAFEAQQMHAGRLGSRAQCGAVQFEQASTNRIANLA